MYAGLGLTLAPGSGYVDYKPHVVEIPRQFQPINFAPRPLDDVITDMQYKPWAPCVARGGRWIEAGRSSYCLERMKRERPPPLPAQPAAGGPQLAKLLPLAAVAALLFVT